MEQTINKQCTNGSIKIHQFNGKRAKYITQYMVPHVVEENPHTVVLVAGGNDIPEKVAPIERLGEITNYLVEGALRCRNEYGVSEIVISSILPRKDSMFQRNRHLLNDLLRKSCLEHNFTFLEHGNIILKNHLCYDGVHLNKSGSAIFSDNLIEVLNT